MASIGKASILPLTISVMAATVVVIADLVAPFVRYTAYANTTSKHDTIDPI